MTKNSKNLILVKKKNCSIRTIFLENTVFVLIPGNTYVLNLIIFFLRCFHSLTERYLYFFALNSWRVILKILFSSKLSWLSTNSWSDVTLCSPLCVPCEVCNKIWSFLTQRLKVHGTVNGELLSKLKGWIGLIRKSIRIKEGAMNHDSTHTHINQNHD